MGGCLSCEPDEEDSTRPITYSLQQNDYEVHSNIESCTVPTDPLPATNSINTNLTNTGVTLQVLKNHSQIDQQHNIDEQVKPKDLSGFYKTVIQYCINNLNWTNMLNIELKFVSLEFNSYEFIQVMETFLRTTKRNLCEITSIERIQNPYLMGLYLLKKNEMMNRYINVSEMALFHGTTSENVMNICQNNFNWRLCGTAKGNIYGRGVSFSPISHYSCYYCDKTNNKVVLLVNVLVAKSCIGNGNMVIPPYINRETNTRFDTSQKVNGHVVVKYADDEFYPVYKINFRILNRNAFFNKISKQ